MSATLRVYLDSRITREEEYIEYPQQRGAPHREFHRITLSTLPDGRIYFQCGSLNGADVPQALKDFSISISVLGSFPKFPTREPRGHEYGTAIGRITEQPESAPGFHYVCTVTGYDVDDVLELYDRIAADVLPESNVKEVWWKTFLRSLVI